MTLVDRTSFAPRVAQYRHSGQIVLGEARRDEAFFMNRGDN